MGQWAQGRVTRSPGRRDSGRPREAAEELWAARLGDRRGEGVDDGRRIAEVLEGLARRLEEAAAGQAVAGLEGAPALVREVAARIARLQPAREGEPQDPESIKAPAPDFSGIQSFPSPGGVSNADGVPPPARTS